MTITKSEAVGLVLVAVLFAIWPVPHTVALRNTFLFLSVISYIVLARRAYRFGPFPIKGLLHPSVWFGLLTIWMFVVALWISNETAWSLDEIRSQWLAGIAAFVLGILMAVTMADRPAPSQRVMLILGVILFVHMLAVDIAGVYMWSIGKGSYRIAGLTGGPDKSSYLTNIFLVLLLTDLLLRSQRRQRLIPVSNVAIYIALAVSVISIVFERMRNELAALAVVLIVGALIYIWFAASAKKLSSKRIAGLVAALVVTAGLPFVAIGLKPGTSLDSALATVSIALDTTTHQEWAHPEREVFPTLPNGKPVDISAYLRIAWFKEGVRIVSEHPFGIGFGRNAFKHGLAPQYGDDLRLGHSHSGLLDLTIGVGIPGAVLWLGFLASLVLIAFRNFSSKEPGYAIALALLVTDFTVRMLLDSIIRDHMIQMFLFLAGLLLVLTACRRADVAQPAPVK